jgi:hypothetical protein
MCWIEWWLFQSIPTSIKRVVGLRNSACEILKISFLHNSSIYGKTHKLKIRSCSKWCAESNNHIPLRFWHQLSELLISETRHAKFKKLHSFTTPQYAGKFINQNCNLILNDVLNLKISHRYNSDINQASYWSPKLGKPKNLENF